jgi:hypothetical protein
MTRYEIQGIHCGRALLLQDRRKRRNQARELEVRDRARKAERSLAIAQRDLAALRGRVDDVLPVYIRAQELQRRHFGTEFALTVAFNPHCIWRASLDIDIHRRGHDVYELDRHARWVAEDAAQKIRHTIMEEIRKQTGIPGAPHGR